MTSRPTMTRNKPQPKQQPNKLARIKLEDTPTPPEQLDAESRVTSADVDRSMEKVKRFSPFAYALLMAKPEEPAEKKPRKAKKPPADDKPKDDDAKPTTA